MNYCRLDTIYKTPEAAKSHGCKKDFFFFVPPRPVSSEALEALKGAAKASSPPPCRCSCLRHGSGCYLHPSAAPAHLCVASPPTAHGEHNRMLRTNNIAPASLHGCSQVSRTESLASKLAARPPAAASRPPVRQCLVVAPAKKDLCRPRDR